MQRQRMIETKELLVSDISAAAALDKLVFPESAWSENTFESELTQNNRYYLALFDQGNLIGYGGVFLNGPESDLQTLVISPKYQRQGLASKLLTKLLEKAKASGAKRVFLEVVFDNEGAINLYKKFNFERIAIRKNYYPNGKAAIIMQLDWRGL